VSALALLLVVSAAAQAPPPPTFRVDVEGVYVDVFVTDGNRPVVGLTAELLRRHVVTESPLLEVECQLPSLVCFIDLE